MATEVFTKSTCVRCGIDEIRAGNHTYPPHGWADFILRYWEETSGGNSVGEIVNGDLCPACAQAVKDFFKGVVDA